MTDDPPDRESLSPEDAFAALGDETRLRILRELAEAETPLSFSALYDRTDLSDSSQFNYHLDRLVGHFVEKSDEGYGLARPGERVVEAVLSGAVTETPALDRTGIDESCRHCGGPVEAEYESGCIRLYCTECAGTFADRRADAGDEQSGDGYLGRLPLPPAGLRDRSPTQAARAAWTWTNLEILAMSAGLCPRCGASVDYETDVCEAHDAGGFCEACRRRHAVGVGVSCPNCTFESGGTVAVGVAATTPFLDFLTDSALNPVAPAAFQRVDAVHENHDIEVLGTDPFEARLTFSTGDGSLTLTVDEAFDVRAVERAPE